MTTKHCKALLITTCDEVWIKTFITTVIQNFVMLAIHPDLHFGFAGYTALKYSLHWSS